MNDISKIAYVENGVGYIFEDVLPKCGCGGSPEAYFSIYKDKLVNVAITCKECGITTGICDTAERAISIWCKAFENIEHLKNKLKEYEAYEDDICLGGFHGDN